MQSRSQASVQSSVVFVSDNCLWWSLRVCWDSCLLSSAVQAGQGFLLLFSARYNSLRRRTSVGVWSVKTLKFWTLISKIQKNVGDEMRPNQGRWNWACSSSLGFLFQLAEFGSLMASSPPTYSMERHLPCRKRFPAIPGSNETADPKSQTELVKRKTLLSVNNVAATANTSHCYLMKKEASNLSNFANSLAAIELWKKKLCSIRPVGF